MATPVLIFANIAIFILTRLPPEILPNAQEIVDMGESVGFAVWDGELWRLLTAMFLHANFLHLGMNMYGLYILGPVLEREIGTWRFLAVYFVAGIFGFAVSLIFLEPRSPTLGASGALFGLMGALLGNEMRVGRHALEFLDRDYGRALVGLAVVNLVLGFTLPGINNAAHIGGLVSSLVLVQAGLVRQVRKLDRTGWLLRLAAVILCIQTAVYSFFPVFDGYWQYHRAVVASRNRDVQACLGRLERALTLEPGLAERLWAQQLLQWVSEAARSQGGNATQE
jgi:membrane associated rhomboid family serine protease